MIKIRKRTDNLPAILCSDEAKASAKKIEAKAKANQLKSNDFDSDIYGCSEVKDALKEDQYGKCAYCEASLTGDFAPVEHYRPKTLYKEIDGSTGLGYYWLAYNWDNLLCSCDRCNSAARKGNLFPLRDPRTRNIANQDTSKEEPLIINPSVDDPECHIHFNAYMAVAVDNDGNPSDKGAYTIKVFDLNGEAENKPYTELKEDRKRVWNDAQCVLDMLMERGTTRDEAINEVVSIFGKKESPYAGMILHQLMWP